MIFNAIEISKFTHVANGTKRVAELDLHNMKSVVKSVLVVLNSTVIPLRCCSIVNL